jgi:acetyl esterase
LRGEMRVPLSRAKELIYRQIGATKLRLYVMEPEPTTEEARPAVVFFFGGGWINGNPAQFAPQCRYLATRGMVAIAADYRVRSRHGTTPFEAIADGQAAIRWVRQHAQELEVSAKQIVASGGSAGGHVAACTALLPEENGGLPGVSCVPNALVLFNPVLDATEGMVGRHFGDRAVQGSPYHHLLPGTPPTLILHGTADATVPYSQAVRFAERMRELGDRCELIGFQGKTHGFFNYGRDDNLAYHRTLEEMDRFLISLGYLQPKC